MTMDRATQNEISRIYTELRLLRERIDRSYVELYGTILPGGGGPAAPMLESYVVISGSAVLPNERVLTAGADTLLTDGGAGGNATVARAGNKVLRFDKENAALVEYAKTAAGAAAALAAAATGDIVELPPGVYTGDLSVPAGVTLLGHGWTNTTIVGKVVLADGACIANLAIATSESSAGKVRALSGPDTGSASVMMVSATSVNTGAGTAYALCPGNGTMFLYDCKLDGETGDVE